MFFRGGLSSTVVVDTCCFSFMFLSEQFEAWCPNVEQFQHPIFDRSFFLCSWVGVDLLPIFFFPRFLFPFPFLAWDARAWFPSSSWGFCKLFLDNTLASSWTQLVHNQSNLGNHSHPQILWTSDSYEEGNPLRVNVTSFASSMVSQMALSWSLNWENFIK